MESSYKRLSGESLQRTLWIISAEASLESFSNRFTSGVMEKRSLSCLSTHWIALPTRKWTDLNANDKLQWTVWTITTGWMFNIERNFFRREWRNFLLSGREWQNLWHHLPQEWCPHITNWYSTVEKLFYFNIMRRDVISTLFRSRFINSNVGFSKLNATEGFGRNSFSKLNVTEDMSHTTIIFHHQIWKRLENNEFD